MSPPVRHALAPLLCAALVSCGGDDTPASSVAPEDGPDADPVLVTDTDPGDGEVGVPAAPGADVAPLAEVPEVPPGTSLRIDTTRLCTTVGETFELTVEAEPPASADGERPASTDVSASVTLTQSLGEGLELLSQGDGAITLRMTARDIVALRADLADAIEPSSGRTVYVAGFAADAPASLLMTKPVAGGCLYALRLPERGFCGTALVRGGSASLGSGDTVVAVDGCTYEAPAGLAVVELPAGPTAAGDPVGALGR